MIRLFRNTLLAVVSLALLATVAHAQNDTRMVVEIPANEHGEFPPVRDAIQSALPQLWDRILPAASRSSVSDDTNATQFLLRVVPQSKSMQVIFNEQRVWQYLDEKQIAYLKEPVHLNIRFQMLNQNDQPMPKTAEALQAYALQFAPDRGIVVDQQSPMITASWRWLDASQVSMYVQGEGMAESMAETRLVDARDPIVKLQAWVAELMLRLRDGGVAGSAAADAQMVDPYAQSVAGTLLTIEQQAPLPEQVVLEEALRQDHRVKSITPTYLSAASRQYRLQLKDNDDSWIVSWFRRRGMLAQPVPEGWLIR